MKQGEKCVVVVDDDPMVGSWVLSAKFRPLSAVDANSPQYNIFTRINIEPDHHVTGSYESHTISGRASNDLVAFEMDFGNMHISLEGRYHQEHIEGENRLPDGRAISWTAQREFPRYCRPSVKDFEPTGFANVFSAEQTPALHLVPGDVVRTWCVDSEGWDKNHKRYAIYEPALTGPFYIHGALPGDVLVVHINKVRLTRDSAIGGAGFDIACMTQGYVKQLFEETNGSRNTKTSGAWKLDRKNGVGFLANPTERLKSFNVKLNPTIGCLGVAPLGRQARLGSDCGSYGGDLDFFRIRSGATLYFPVFHPGALLSLGDGHGAHGDGEVGGDALETPVELEFGVDVIRSKKLLMPRLEDRECIAALGISGSLSEAVERATSELAWWVQDEFAMKAEEAAIILGSSLRYNIAKFKPRSVVAASIAKSVLATLDDSSLQ